MARRIHVVGAGIAGLAAAVELVASGYPVTLYEQAGHAGGRCRSFFDDTLQRSIDNGNHLVLSGNRSLYAFLRQIGASDRLSGPARAAFPFIDLQTGERWTVRPGSGPVPWWIFAPKRRVRGTRVRDYLAGLRFARAEERSTVAECVGWHGPLSPLLGAAGGCRAQHWGARGSRAATLASAARDVRARRGCLPAAHGHPRFE